MSEKLTNPCLTLHQPWASLLVHGIKRIEGRNWPAPIRGRLWIHAAAKVPDQETIESLESFYSYIYGLDGVTDIKFPENYPTSVLLGCVSVAGCETLEDFANRKELSEGVRLEPGETKYCWLCEEPQRLLLPFAMRGRQRVYNLEKKLLPGAERGLRVVTGPLPAKFPQASPANSTSTRPLDAPTLV